jgi:NTP pyrophosphatase (non-canonical NTP hydrolase)
MSTKAKIMQESFDRFFAITSTFPGRGEDSDILVCRVGIIEEVGEVARWIKRYFRGDAKDLKELNSELGDVLAYVAIYTTYIGLKFTDKFDAEYENLKTWRLDSSVDFLLSELTSSSLNISRLKPIEGEFYSIRRYQNMLGDLTSLIEIIAERFNKKQIKAEDLLDAASQKIKLRIESKTVLGSGSAR